MISGIAVAGAVFASRQELYGAFVPALRDAYLLGGLFTALSVFLSIPGFGSPDRKNMISSSCR
jgi:hypothetical protein